MSCSELFSQSIFVFIAEQEPDNEELNRIIIASQPPNFAFNNELQLTMPTTPPLPVLVSTPQSALSDSE